MTRSSTPAATAAYSPAADLLLPLSGIFTSLFAHWLLLRLLRHLRSPRNSMLDAPIPGRFRFHYQPIILLRDGKIAGLKCWRAGSNLDGHLLSPDIFISWLSKPGLIAPADGRYRQENFCRLRSLAEAAAGSAYLHQPVGGMTYALPPYPSYYTISCSTGDRRGTDSSPEITRQVC